MKGLLLWSEWCNAGDDRMLPQTRPSGKKPAGRARDRGRIHLVVTVEFAPRARLAEVVHPERDLRDPEGDAPPAPRGR